LPGKDSPPNCASIDGAITLRDTRPTFPLDMKKASGKMDFNETIALEDIGAKTDYET